eukprot:364100-Chlamydomonas_euryale.AAC.32
MHWRCVGWPAHHPLRPTQAALGRAGGHHWWPTRTAAASLCERSDGAEFACLARVAERPTGRPCFQPCAVLVLPRPPYQHEAPPVETM